MHELKITGGSDDLIEIYGDIREEFGVHMDDDEKKVLAISDGSLFSVEYDKDGIWRFLCMAKGAAEIIKVEGIVADDTFDVVTLKSETPFRWVVLGDKSVVRKGK